MDNSKLCIIKILEKYGASTTMQILERTNDFPDLCKDCRSGNKIIRSAQKLVEDSIEHLNLPFKFPVVELSAIMWTDAVSQ